MSQLKPLFLKHYKSSNDKTGVKYNVGNSKESHINTWSFCDALHFSRIKWNTHTANTCRTRIRMMEDQGDSNPTANRYDAPPDSNSIQDNTDISSISDATYSSDMTSLLASAFNLMSNHPEGNDTVTSALMGLNQSQWLYHILILVICILLYL